MAKQQTKQPELLDAIALALDVDIVDREAFAQRVSDVLVSLIAPRMFVTALKLEGVISPKKAEEDARGAREVTAP